MLNIIDGATWNNYYNFAVRYCEGKQGYWGFEAKGASNLVELKSRISRYFLRRTKEEVLKELPPKNRIEVPIDLPKDLRDQYDLAESNLVQYMRTYKKEKTDKEIVKSLQAEKLVRLNFLREINALGKVPAAKELSLQPAQGSPAASTNVTCGIVAGATATWAEHKEAIASAARASSRFMCFLQ